MTQTIAVIEGSNQSEFMGRVEEYLAEDYRISSTSCGFINSERFRFSSIFHAILVKEIIQQGHKPSINSKSLENKLAIDAATSTIKNNEQV